MNFGCNLTILDEVLPADWCNAWYPVLECMPMTGGEDGGFLSWTYRSAVSDNVLCRWCNFCVFLLCGNGLARRV